MEFYFKSYYKYTILYLQYLLKTLNFLFLPVKTGMSMGMVAV